MKIKAFVSDVCTVITLTVLLGGCTSEPLISRKGGIAAAELAIQGMLVLAKSEAGNPVERNIEDSGRAYLGGVIPVKGQLRERARPVENGARLFVDGRARGTIPLSANLPEPGPHIVRLEIPGWQPHTMKLAHPVRLPVGEGEVESWPPLFVNCKTGEIFTAQKLPSLDPYHSGAGGNPNNTFRVGRDPMFIVTTADNRSRGWTKLGQMLRAASERQ